MNMITKDIGALGEKQASKFLKSKGFKILSRNYKSSHGEIDIVAKDGDCVVFVEVKARQNNQKFFDEYGRPFDAVNDEKQRHIISAARAYIRECKNTLCDFTYRFDVIEVYLERNKAVKIEHIESAFTA